MSEVATLPNGKPVVEQWYDPNQDNIFAKDSDGQVFVWSEARGKFEPK